MLILLEETRNLDQFAGKSTPISEKARELKSDISAIRNMAKQYLNYSIDYFTLFIDNKNIPFHYKTETEQAIAPYFKTDTFLKKAATN